MSEIALDSGLLLVGHGTREPAGLEGFWSTVAEFQRLRPGVVIEGCFLEFSRPTIAEGIARLLAAGAKRIAVAPLMLFAARHVRKDVPAAVAAALPAEQGVPVRYLSHLGLAPPVIELARERLADAASGAAIQSEETLLLAVGRGSRDREATAEMFQLAERVAEGRGVAVEICFLAMAQPSLEEGLRRAASSPVHRVMVLPHLLFPGVLFNRVAARVEEARRSHREKQWLLAQPLGADRQLAVALRAAWLGGW